MPGRNYVAKSGEAAVMAEFLIRGYNVAPPLVDVGDDIFVVHDEKGTLWRIQVKTATGQPRNYGSSGQFAVDLEQLATAKLPDLFYVFALRTAHQWEFLVVPRVDLRNERHGTAEGAPKETPAAGGRVG